MAKKLSLTPFSLRAIVLHLSLLAITLRYAKTDDEVHSFTFFMHDILGGSNPSERIVAGIITNTQTTNIPFSKPNNRVLPLKGSIPLVDTSIDNTNHEPNPIINGSPTSTTVIRNIGKNKVIINRNSLPYVTPNQLPLGSTLKNLLFGRITVIDDEITKGHELESEVIGKAQGFHLASSLDGSSRTMAFTAMFHGEDHEEEDAISFFGVHQTAAQESYIAVVGGTGKYGNAKGYAKIETLQPDQYITNGVETLLQITVYPS